MTEVHHDSVEFAHKQTWFGIVLMVRYADPDDIPGVFKFCRWRKADFADLALYNALAKEKQ